MAATPIGLKVMKELQEENPNKEKATDAMCMFLGMNTAGFQIIPATVIAVLVGAGASNPTDIILPTLIVTTLSFLTAITAANHTQKNMEGRLNYARNNFSLHTSYNDSCYFMYSCSKKSSCL